MSGHSLRTMATPAAYLHPPRTRMKMRGSIRLAACRRRACRHWAGTERAAAAGGIAMAHMTLQECARLQRQDLMDDIAHHLGRALQIDGPGIDLARHLAADPDRVGLDVAGDRRSLAYGQRPALDVTLHDAVDLGIPGACQIAVDLQIAADDGGCRAARCRPRRLACHGARRDDARRPTSDFA